MPNNDISDLHGIYPASLRWSAENGILGVAAYDQDTGERTVDPIELGSAAARFAMDYVTRQRGCGLIAAGRYDMQLSPVGSPPPPWLNDEEYKPAIACWMWNPVVGEVRVETNAAIFRTALSAVWGQCRGAKEAADVGKVPIIGFDDRRTHVVKSLSKSFWAPIVHVLGWVDRERISCFAMREPTVMPPKQLTTELSRALLGTVTPAGKKKRAPKPGTLEELLDDEIPDLVR